MLGPFKKGVNKVSSILFLFDSQRNLIERRERWTRFITASGAEYLSDVEGINFADSVNCIFTHSTEYQDGILGIVDVIGDIPVVVFSGGVTAIQVDNTRKVTFWMPLTWLDPRIDELIVGLLARINSGATANEVLEYIRELNRSAYPETLAAAYLLMIAREKKIDAPLDSLSVEQWKEACDQYKGIGGDKNANWGDVLGWDGNKIGEVKKEIRVLLSPVASQTR